MLSCQIKFSDNFPLSMVGSQAARVCVELNTDFFPALVGEQMSWGSGSERFLLFHLRKIGPGHSISCVLYSFTLCNQRFEVNLTRFVGPWHCVEIPIFWHFPCWQNQKLRSLSLSLAVSTQFFFLRQTSLNFAAVEFSIEHFPAVGESWDGGKIQFWNLKY